MIPTNDFIFQKKVDEILGEKTDNSTSVEINVRPNNFDQSRKTLQKAFSESPYDRYISKVSPKQNTRLWKSESKLYLKLSQEI